MVHTMYKFLLIFFLLPVVSEAQNFGGNPAGQRWMQVNSSSSRVIFPKGLDSQANRISNVVALLDSTTLYSIGNKMRKWNIVLLNQSTDANAYVRLAPVISELYLVPPQNSFSNGSVRWDDNLIIHEDRHMQQFSNFNNGLTKVFSFFLGQEGQLLANGITIPDYFFEGDAVWQETLVSKQGRGRMPWFYNGLKSLWQDKKKYAWMKLRSGSLLHYTPDHYELGYPLVAWGYEKYGEDFWRKVTADAVSFKGLFYSFIKAIERHSGKSYRQFQEDALLYFKEQTVSADTTNDALNYITPLANNNVVDYLFPQFVNDDTIIVTKKSYKEINSFYFLINGKEEKLRVKNYVTDDYFSYNNGKLVYAAYQSDPRWANRNYSVILLLDIYNKQQKQLTTNSKYFSPDINAAGTEVIAVNVNPDGSNFLHRLDAATGELISEVRNPNNYFFTQTKYLDSNTAVAAVRDPQGQMALIKINLTDGATEPLTPFSYSVIGYPQVMKDQVYFSMTDHYSSDKNLKTADRIFAIDLKSKKLYRITDNNNGVYHPSVNATGELLFTAFTSDGSRLVKTNIKTLKPAIIERAAQTVDIPAQAALQKKGAGILYQLAGKKIEVTKYRKSFQLFNFHSARPFGSDPEYGYEFYSDNILTSFSNILSYTFNRNERSHTVGYDAVFAGWFPYLRLGAAYSANRNIDTSLTSGIHFNSAKLNAGISVPLTFINGRTFTYLNVGIGYNIEQIPYIGIGKDVFNNLALKYGNAFLSFTNQSRQARQHINPRWAQTVSFNYRDAFTFFKGNKMLSAASLYFPGLLTNHSLVFNAAYQTRDTVPDFFSNNFAYSRGYEALNTRRMFKLGVNYHFPLLYPDWGVGNIVFLQRIRGNAFYDYTSARARVNGVLTNIINRSTGGEIYFDTKIWNALPASIGVRYSHLLDTDLRYPVAIGRWEIILPINLVPN